jgi:hypothetical protein
LQVTEKGQELDRARKYIRLRFMNSAQEIGFNRNYRKETEVTAAETT